MITRLPGMLVEVPVICGLKRQVERDGMVEESHPQVGTGGALGMVWAAKYTALESAKPRDLIMVFPRESTMLSSDLEHRKTGSQDIRPPRATQKSPNCLGGSKGCTRFCR